jgi:hypothetical protein
MHNKAFSLHNAVLNGEINQIFKEILLSENLDSLYAGKSALHLAVENNLDHVVKLLVINGAHINQLSQEKKTAADIAIETHNLDILKILVGHRARLKKHINSDIRAYMQLEWALTRSYGRDLFPFISPLFFCDTILFIKLREYLREKKFEAWVIEEVLWSLALENFPSGAPGEEAMFELRALLKEINASQKLHTAILIALENRPHDIEIDALFTRVPPEIKNYESLNISVTMLAQALTLRESKLFKALTTWNFIDWLYDEELGIEIDKYLNFSVNIKLIFTYLIRKSYSKRDRKREIKKILELGEEFLILNNLSGVRTVVAVFYEPTIKKIWTPKNKDKKNLKKLEEIVSPHAGYEKYHRHVAKLSDTQSYIPILEIFLNNLGYYYNKNDQLTDFEYLIKIAQVLRDLNAVKKREDYKLEPYGALNTILDKTVFGVFGEY